MYKTIIKTFFIILLASVSLLLAVAFFTEKIYDNTLLSFIGYFYLSCFCFKYFSKKLSLNAILVIIFATILLLQAFTIYTWFVWEAFGLPVVVADCFAVISAYFYVKNKSPKNLVLFLLSSCFVVFMYFQGWEVWIHKINYGTFTGKVSVYKLQQKIEGINQQNEQINNQTLTNKIVLLDFWHTKCGACFEKFPQLQAFYDKHKNDDSIAVFAVDKPLDEDKEKSAFKVIEEEGYNFPVLLPTDEEIPEKFGVKYYPTTFVIDKQGNVVYKGGIEGAILMVEELKKL
jgi:thiol-disulfide isomerase/thioredoxin